MVAITITISAAAVRIKIVRLITHLLHYLRRQQPENNKVTKFFVSWDTNSKS